MKKHNRTIVSIILAAGKGTRMCSPQLHKVCFDLNGRPVIAHTMETFQRCGIETHFIVVGELAEQVMRAVTELNAKPFFCYQPRQLGTGNAAKAAAILLSAIKYDGDILIIAGDKVVDESVLLKLIDTYYSKKSDFAFLVDNVKENKDAGRIIYDDQRKPIGICEVFDISKVQLLNILKTKCEHRPISAQNARKLTLDSFPREDKAALALGPLWDSICAGKPISGEDIRKYFNENDFFLILNNIRIDVKNLAHAQDANLSIYLSGAEPLYYALNKLTSENAQQEEYLTQVVEILYHSHYQVHTLHVDSSEQVMSFNTPTELDRIRKVMSKNSANLNLTQKNNDVKTN